MNASPDHGPMGYLMAAAFVFYAFLGCLARSLGLASFVNSRLVTRFGTRTLANGA